MQTQSQLPSIPEAPASVEQSKARKGKGIIVTAAITVAAVVGIGVATTAGSDETPVGTNPVAVEQTEPQADVAELASESAVLSDSAVNHMTNALDYLDAFDVNGAASEMDAAADDIDEMSLLWSGTDERISGDSALAATYLHSAADNLRSMNLNKATSDLSASTDLIDGLTTYLNDTYL